MNSKEMGAGFGKKEKKAFDHAIVLEERRGDPKKNEDQVFYEEDENVVVASVFDGATILGDVEYFTKIGKTPGRLASEIAVRVVREEPMDSSPAATILKVNEKLREEAGEIPVTEKIRSELLSTTGIVVKIDKETRVLTFARAGDCIMVIMNERGECSWNTDSQAEKFEALEIQKAVEVSGREQMSLSAVLGHPEVVSVIEENRRRENDPSGNGYCSLKGSADQVMLKYLEIGQVPLRLGYKVFIFTDGMLVAPLAIRGREQKAMAEDALRRGGIHMLLQEVRRIQEQDSECKDFNRLKQFDDAAGVEISVS